MSQVGLWRFLDAEGLQRVPPAVQPLLHVPPLRLLTSQGLLCLLPAGQPVLRLLPDGLAIVLLHLQRFPRLGQLPPGALQLPLLLAQLRALQAELLPQAAVSGVQGPARVLELLRHLQICLARRRDVGALCPGFQAEM